MTDKNKLYTVSELASEFGITTRTIRHYEDEQLLLPRRVGGNRIFDYRDKGRLSLILRLKALGFMLKQIKEYLDLYDVDETHVTQLKMGFRGICDRIEEIEDQIRRFEDTRTELISLKDEVVKKLREREVDPEMMI